MSHAGAMLCEVPLIPGALAVFLAALCLFFLLCTIAAAREGERGLCAALIAGMASALMGIGALDFVAIVRACW